MQSDLQDQTPEQETTSRAEELAQTSTYNITRSLSDTRFSLEDILSSTGGEITEQADKLLEQLEALEEAIPKKADRIEGYHEHLEYVKDMMMNSSEYYENKAKHYKELAKRVENSQERLKNLLMSLLENVEGKKIERDGKANLTLVERDYLKVDDSRVNIDALVEQFGERVVKRKVQISKKDLTKAVESGDLEELPEGLYYETSKWIRGI